MIQAKCIEKFRNKQGKIYGYRLIDLNGQTQDVESNNLKRAIRDGKINIINLRLTTNNRLVDCEEKQLTNTELLGPAPRQIEVKKPNKKKRAYDAESYKEFAELLLGLMEDSLSMNNRTVIDSFSIDTDGEIKSLLSKIGPFTYKDRKVCLELEVLVNKVKKQGSFGWAVMEINGSKLPLYGKSCPLYINNIKADFNKILKISQEVMYHVKGELRYNKMCEVI